MALINHARAWYIDAWSPNDGLLFVSQRRSRDDPWDDDGNSVTTLAIRAPSFVPEPVDRSMAFGAVRRGFQECFSLDGEGEHAFDSLQQLITFARRIYSGSGPGTLSGVGQVEPGPLPGGGDLAGGFLEFEVEAESSLRERPLDTLHEMILPGQRERAITGLLTSKARLAAAACLLEGAMEADLQGVDIASLVHLAAAASFVVASSHDWEFVRNLAFRLQAPQHRVHWGDVLVYWNDLTRSPRSSIERSPLPRQLTDGMDLPESVRTLFDLLVYVRADRSFVAGPLTPKRLALLIAVAAGFCVHRLPRTWRNDVGYGPFAEETERDIALFIADWLPIEPLPEVLEQEIQRWCRRGPLSQRGQVTEGGL